MSENPYRTSIHGWASAADVWDEGFAAGRAAVERGRRALHDLLEERDDENGALRMEVDAADADAARLAAAVAAWLKFDNDVEPPNSDDYDVLLRFEERRLAITEDAAAALAAHRGRVGDAQP